MSGPPGPHGEPLDRFLLAWDAHESCYLERLERVLAREAGWRERFRAATAETLCLAEEERAAAHLLVVAPFSHGAPGQERRRRLMVRLATCLDTARAELPADAVVSPLAAEWVLAAFFTHIYRRLRTASGPDLRTQLPELLFLGVAAYFGPEAALAELRALRQGLGEG